MVHTHDSLRLLAVESAEAFAKSGAARPVVPHGLRDEVIAALMAVTADPDLLDVYVDAVRSERIRLGVDERLLMPPYPDVPAEEVAEKGFECLSDAHLGELAVCPDVLEGLLDFLFDADVPLVMGKWWGELPIDATPRNSASN